MAKRVLFVLMAVGVLTSAACGSARKADGTEDVVGIWQRTGGGSVSFCQYAEDGSYLCAGTLEEIRNNEGFQGQYWFEDGRYHDLITEESNCLDAGIYQIELLPNGNLKFIVVEDACRDRVSEAAGRGIEEGKIEWQPVP